jgi:hypothetical protein
MPRILQDRTDDQGEDGRWSVEVSPGVVMTFGGLMAATAAATVVECNTEALAKLKRLWASEVAKACVGRNSRFGEVQVDLTPIPENLLLPFIHEAVDK